MDFVYAPGATPLDPDEAAGLIPAHISTQGALNAWEEVNISAGERWALRQRRTDLLDEVFLRELHRKMFGETWNWAGKFRSSNKSIGTDWTQVVVSLRHLLDDIKVQIEHKVYETDELAIRFHHRLVWIHPFPNGNGRHARLMADLLALRLERPRFTWGSQQGVSLLAPNQVRQDYIEALRKADKGEIEALLKFART
jgi:Fic-DOC domain mobile mystery protein B